MNLLKINILNITKDGFETLAEHQKIFNHIKKVKNQTNGNVLDHGILINMLKAEVMRLELHMSIL